MNKLELTCKLLMLLEIKDKLEDEDLRCLDGVFVDSLSNTRNKSQGARYIENNNNRNIDNLVLKYQEIILKNDRLLYRQTKDVIKKTINSIATYKEPSND